MPIHLHPSNSNRTSEPHPLQCRRCGAWLIIGMGICENGHSM